MMLIFRLFSHMFGFKHENGAQAFLLIHCEELAENRSDLGYGKSKETYG